MMKPFPWGVFWRKTSVLGCCLFPPLLFGPPPRSPYTWPWKTRCKFERGFTRWCRRPSNGGLPPHWHRWRPEPHRVGGFFRRRRPLAERPCPSETCVCWLLVGPHGITLQHFKGIHGISIVALSYVLFSDGSSFSGNLLELTNAWSKPDMTEICFEREDFVHHCTWRRLSFVHMNMNIIEIYACISYIIYLSHTWNDFIWYTNIERRAFSVCTLCGLVADVDCNHSKVHGQHWVSHRKKLALAPWAFWIHPQMGMKLYFYS